jgi:hypothetical protein
MFENPNGKFYYFLNIFLKEIFDGSPSFLINFIEEIFDSNSSYLLNFYSRNI